MAKAKTTPEAATHVLKASQWQEMPHLQKQLRELLDNPVFKLAVQTLLYTAMPNASPVIQLVPGISAEAMVYADSARYHNRSGFAQFQRALVGLTRLKNKKKVGADFGELLPESE